MSIRHREGPAAQIISMPCAGVIRSFGAGTKRGRPKTRARRNSSATATPPGHGAPIMGARHRRPSIALTRLMPPQRRRAMHSWKRNIAQQGDALDLLTSLPDACAALAAHSAVDALVYSLRRGIEAIAEPDNQRRLAELSEDQLLAVCQRLQNFKPNIASAWPPEEVEAIASIWSAVHVSR